LPARPWECVTPGGSATRPSATNSIPSIRGAAKKRSPESHKLGRSILGRGRSACECRAKSRLCLRTSAHAGTHGIRECPPGAAPSASSARPKLLVSALSRQSQVRAGPRLSRERRTGVRWARHGRGAPVQQCSSIIDPLDMGLEGSRLDRRIGGIPTANSHSAITVGAMVKTRGATVGRPAALGPQFRGPRPGSPRRLT